MVDIENIEQKLDQTEKIILIFSQSSNNNDYMPVLKLFAKQLYSLRECNKIQHSSLFERYPNLNIWLKLTNISPQSLESIVSSNLKLTFHDFFEKNNDSELIRFLSSPPFSINNEQDLNNINTSFQNLKKHYDNLEKGISSANSNTSTPIAGYTGTTPVFHPAINQPHNLFNNFNNSQPNNTTNTAPSTPKHINQTFTPSTSTSSALSNFSSNNNNNNTSNNTTSNNNNNNNNNNISQDLNYSNNNKIFQKRSELDLPLNPIVIRSQSASTTPTVSNSNSSSNLISVNNSNISNTPSNTNKSITPTPNISKNLTFSPVLQAKSSNKKSGGHKVTTPPPQRKLSIITGNIINSPHLQAAAKAAYLNASSNYSNLNTPTNMNPNDQLITPNNTNIQRSSSHESQLRLRNQVAPLITNHQQNQQYLTTNNSSKINIKNSSISDLNENSFKNSLNNFNKNSFESINKLHNDSGTEFSSRSQSEQASPSKVNDDANRALKSPKSFQEHRFLKYIRIKNIKTCEVCLKPLWHGIKCKYCKIRCHKECEKKYTPYCRENSFAALVNNSFNQGTSGIPAPLTISNEINAYNNNNSQTGSSSVSSSAQQSPAILMNNLSSTSNNVGQSSSNIFIPSNPNNASTSSLVDESNSPSSSIAWPSGAAKVARLANKIVDTINLVSTPKTSQRSLNNLNNNTNQYLPNNSQDYQNQHNIATTSSSKVINSNNIESRSSSSCNSSEPNSPNNAKQFYLQNQQHHQHIYLQSNLPKHQTNVNNMDKKSSSSSISSAYSGSQSQSQLNNSMNKLNVLTPINSLETYNSNSNNNLASPKQSIKSQSGTPSTGRHGEFFPSHLDPNNNNMNNITEYINVKQAKPDNEEDRTTKEVRESLRLDFRKNNNHLTVNNYENEDDFYNYNNNDKSNNDNEIDDEKFNNDDDNNELDNGDQDQLKYSSGSQEFNISYEEIADKVELGRGRFGIVYKAYWHGSIAIKEIDFDENLNEDSEELKKFKEEVLNLRKTFHSNLILFYGACLKPSKCAIVMSLCNGFSLYNYLHNESYTKPNFDRIIDIATQIAQGMGYLHNKKMIHKDLRSKNVLMRDGCKAVITDFGLYSITNLCKKINNKRKKDILTIKKECIYYMAPELVRVLGTNKFETSFSNKTDVFSFGTIWYEMFSYEFPFVSLHSHTLLYLIGGGLKNISPNIQMPKEFKIILLKCWSNDPSTRPEFSRLLETLRAIPKRTKLYRSPSHPVHIGRSLETLHMNDLKN